MAKPSTAESKRPDFGEVMNTVTPMECPTCRRLRTMTVHAEHRVYSPCGHWFALPPIGITSAYGKGPRPVTGGGSRG